MVGCGQCKVLNHGRAFILNNTSIITISSQPWCYWHTQIPWHRHTHLFPVEGCLFRDWDLGRDVMKHLKRIMGTWVKCYIDGQPASCYGNMNINVLVHLFVLVVNTSCGFWRRFTAGAIVIYIYSSAIRLQPPVTLRSRERGDWERKTRTEREREMHRKREKYTDRHR